MHLILISGLPGSGKTTLARTLSLKLTNSMHLEDPAINTIKTALKNKSLNYIIIETPHFCIKDNRTDFMEMLTHIHPKPTKVKTSWICFSNDPELAKFNILERDSGERQIQISTDIEILTNDYTFPSNALLLNVYPEPYKIDAIVKYIHS